MHTLRGDLVANAAALSRARSAPRTGATELEVRRLEEERAVLIRRALGRRDQDSISWMAAQPGVNFDQARAEGNRHREEEIR